MRELLEKALDNAFEVLQKQIPETKIEIKSIPLSVAPINIPSFMKKHNIPDNASLAIGYNMEINFAWDVEVRTTVKDKKVFKKARFSAIAYRFIYDSLMKAGYKRISVESAKLKDFEDTTIYDMYANKDIDKLIRFYSLLFAKE